MSLVYFNAITDDGGLQPVAVPLQNVLQIRRVSRWEAEKSAMKYADVPANMSESESWRRSAAQATISVIEEKGGTIPHPSALSALDTKHTTFYLVQPVEEFMRRLMDVIPLNLEDDPVGAPTPATATTRSGREHERAPAIDEIIDGVRDDARHRTTNRGSQVGLGFGAGR